MRRWLLWPKRALKLRNCNWNLLLKACRVRADVLPHPGFAIRSRKILGLEPLSKPAANADKCSATYENLRPKLNREQRDDGVAACDT